MLQRIKRKHILCALSVSAICVILILAFALFFSSNKKRELSDLNTQYASAIEELNDSLAEREQTIESHEASIEKLNKENGDLEQEISKYEEQQAQIDEINEKFNDLLESYNSLLSEYEESQNEIESQKQQIVSLKAENEKLMESAQQSQEDEKAEAGDSDGTVYWVSDGEVYHSTPNCPALWGAKKVQSGSVAGSGKSRACRICG